MFSFYYIYHRSIEPNQTAFITLGAVSVVGLNPATHFHRNKIFSRDPLMKLQSSEFIKFDFNMARASSSKTKTTDKEQKKTPPSSPPHPSVKPIPGLSSPIKKSPKKMLSSGKYTAEKAHVFEMFRTKNGVYELIGLNHRLNKHDDGYWPYTTGLAREENGFYEGRDKTQQVENKSLLDANVVDALFRRGPNNSILQGETPDRNGRKWARKFLLVRNDPQDYGRDDESIIRTSMQILKTTVDLNRKIDGRNKPNMNKYMISKQIIGKRNDESLPSLDKFLRDIDVLEILKRDNEDSLSPTWAKDYPEAAAIFFSPSRKEYPIESHQFGFENKLSTFNNPEDPEFRDEVENVDVSNVDKYLTVN